MKREYEITNDTITGKLSLFWNEAEFSLIMKKCGFIMKDKTGTYKLNLGENNCTIIAYVNGSVVVNGCSSLMEMKVIINQLFNKNINESSN